MKTPARQRSRGLQFNITPLIDIVFLLIIFFLVATHIVRNEARTEVNLPTASAIDDVEELPSRIVITITEAGEYQLSDRASELSTIEEQIIAGGQELGRAFEVRIRTDRDVPYRVIEPLLTTCAKAGVTRIRFAVRAGG